MTFQASTEADMTPRNGKAEWHGSVESDSGTITVGDITVARIDLETEGDVPGIDERQVQEYAKATKRDCPVSRALAGIPEIILTAKPAHCRLHRRTGAERPMSTNDQRVVHAGRTRTVSLAVARSARRLRLVLEYLGVDQGAWPQETPHAQAN
jgi:hypothetical protein